MIFFFINICQYLWGNFGIFYIFTAHFFQINYNILSYTILGIWVRMYGGNMVLFEDKTHQKYLNDHNTCIVSILINLILRIFWIKIFFRNFLDVLVKLETTWNLNYSLIFYVNIYVDIFIFSKYMEYMKSSNDGVNINHVNYIIKARCLKLKIRCTV